MSEDLYIVFYDQFFKMLHKKRSSHKNNYFIALLSSTHDLLPHSRTSTYISYLTVKDVHLWIVTGAQGRKKIREEEKRDKDRGNVRGKNSVPVAQW